MQHRNYNMFSFFVDPRRAEMLESTSGGSMSTSTLKWWCSTTDDCAQDPDVVFAIGRGADDAVIAVDHLHELAAKTRLNQKMAKIQKHHH
jgi:hypothetical protein